MANEIQDLLNSIADERIRARLATAILELKKTTQFGLVFEKHIPELLPIYSARIRRGTRVSRKAGRLSDTYIVKRVHKDEAAIQPESDSEIEEHVPLSELVVVKRFGEAIFPALRHVESVLTGADTPHHVLIEADNYHALQLLEWLYAGKVDCIYIDPPYNTGARDWKYNNDFVDGNDGWRHSKWLAFMEKRLLLAKQLLKPDSGILIVTIDEHEVHHLGMLLERLFPTEYRQMVTIVITARGVAKQGLARVEEHALFTFLGKSSACSTEDDFLTSSDDPQMLAPWASLLRRGTNATPKDRPGLVYPILIDPTSARIKNVGETLAERVDRGELKKNDLGGFRPTRNVKEAWPIRSDGSLGTWQLKPSTLMELKAKGLAKLGRYNEKRKTWSVTYLKRGPLKELARGDLQIVGYEWEGGPAILQYSDTYMKERRAKTVWHRTLHDAGTYGSNLLRSILGSRSFEFPKSLYAVRDTLNTVIRNNKQALVLDFFAGSGTTLNAIHLLNVADQGTRQCILVTNNELSDEEIQRQKSLGREPGEDDWEANGICRSVTWPRSKFVIQGRRDDGTELEGEYFSGQLEELESDREYRSLEFANFGLLFHEDKSKRRKARESLAQFVDLPKAAVTTDVDYLLADGKPTAVLLHWDALQSMIEAGSELSEKLEAIYFPSTNGNQFLESRRLLEESWQPLAKTTEIKRPMRDGFEANLDYFRLDFLDRSIAETSGRLSDLLPALWMMAGARGALPNCSGAENMLFFPESSFAVLVEEAYFRSFCTKLAQKLDIEWVFLVTNDQDSFARMNERLPDHIPDGHRIHLWRSYLDNFLINIVAPVGPEA